MSLADILDKPLLDMEEDLIKLTEVDGKLFASVWTGTGWRKEASPGGYWVGKAMREGRHPTEKEMWNYGLGPDGVHPLVPEELAKLAEEIRIHNAEIEKEAKRRGAARGSHGYYVGQRIPFEKGEGK